MLIHSLGNIWLQGVTTNVLRICNWLYGKIRFGDAIERFTKFNVRNVSEIEQKELVDEQFGLTIAYITVFTYLKKKRSQVRRTFTLSIIRRVLTENLFPSLCYWSNHQNWCELEIRCLKSKLLLQSWCFPWTISSLQEDVESFSAANPLPRDFLAIQRLVVLINVLKPSF